MMPMDLNWDGYITTSIPIYDWTSTTTDHVLESVVADTCPTWAQSEVGLSDRQKDEAITIANFEARRILKEFFEEITDENLKVDVDALQEYIDSFMKKAT